MGGLPKAGVKVEDLRCKQCGKTVNEQPGDMNDCLNDECPYPKPESE